MTRETVKEAWELEDQRKKEREAWLLSRRTFLGSSDAPAVCGLSPWATPLHIYLSKLGEYEAGDSEPKRWGRKLEEVVAQAYQEETGRPVFPPGQKTTLHPEHPWLGASLDYETWEGGEPRILECKTSSEPDEWGNSGTDEVPDHYNLQVQHQMLCTGMSVADVAVLIRGSDFRIFTVKRNPLLCEKLLVVLSDFWEKVLRRDAPTPDWKHPATGELLKGMYGVDETLRVDLGEEAGQLCRQYLAARERQKEATREKEEVQARLLHLVGSAGVARCPGGYTINRKLVHRQGYPVEPTSYYSFRVSEPKS